YNILSCRDIYHDFSICGMSINMNNEVDIVLKSRLFPMRAPIFNANQVNMVCNYEYRKRDLLYWIISPCNNPIKLINRDQDFSISLVLMHDQKPLLSIVSVPSEDKLYFEYSDKGIFVIEGLREKRFNLPIKSLLTIAKPISIGEINPEKQTAPKDGMKHPSTHYWLG
ncbi:MAG: hypothetical protein SNH45_07445, partial [Rikenellaceae bacterium]